MLGLLKLPFLQADRRMAVPEIFKRGTPQAAFMIGVTFALGWTPCVGPILASILLLASTTATVFSGAILLLVFSLGLAIPFLLVAMLYARSSVVIERYSYVAQSINFIGGVLLLLMGILLMTEQFGTMVEYGYRFFYFIGLGSLFSFF